MNDTTSYIGLGLTFTAIAAAVGYGWYRNRPKQKAVRYEDGFQTGYNMCAGELLRGKVSIAGLEAESWGWPEETDQFARGFDEGMKQALQDWEGDKHG